MSTDSTSLTSTRLAAKEAEAAYLDALGGELISRTPSAVWFGVDKDRGHLTITPAAAELLLEHLTTRKSA